MRVLVTGSASGFGRAIVRELRGRGEHVRGLDLVPHEGGLVADIRDPHQVADGVDQVVRELGGLDVLVNNAGLGVPADAGSAPDEIAQQTLDVNLFGSWRVTAAALPHLLGSKGRVVNMASGLAFVTVPFSAAYAASKRGLTAYSDVLRLEYGGQIKVITVYPGYVKTPIHQRSEELGFSLSNAVPEDRIEQVVATVMRACYSKHPPRDVSTSWRTGAGLWFGRHLPRTTDAAARYRMERLSRRGHFSNVKLTSQNGGWMDEHR
jgi:NAD(P)-dependent dehydrogenase (short-subunit alcohol dehydrogenase family)